METDTKLGRDVFLALAAVGWSDGHLDEDEADAIVRTALEEGLDLEEINEIEKATKEPIDIGKIDISKMSKADRLFVYAVAAWITRVDGVVEEAERAALDKIGEALRIPERPRFHAENIAREIGAISESEKAAFYNLPKLRRTLKVRLEESAKLRAAAKDVKIIQEKVEDETPGAEPDGPQTKPTKKKKSKSTKKKKSKSTKKKKSKKGAASD